MTATMKQKLSALGPSRNDKSSSWTVRRRIIVSTLMTCAALVIYITYKQFDTRTDETIVQSSFALAGTVISGYVFGAVWEDHSKRNALVAGGGMGDDDNNKPPTPPDNT